MKYTAHRINVMLTEEEVEFIKWFGEEYNHNMQKEMQTMFYNDLHHMMELHLDEMRMEKENAQL